VIYNGHYGSTDDLPVMVRRCADVLRPHRTRFDFIAVSGLSGAIVGAPVALRLRRPLVVVRKPEDKHHGCSDLVGELDAVGRYVVLDDLISIGHTFTRIRCRLSLPGAHGVAPRYVGVYLYSDRLLSWEGDGRVTFSLTPDRLWADVSVNRGDTWPSD
jgi:hypothetical protein